ncbi:MAG: hypothetical protein J0653_06240, partial [Deltaproteobacteria bacterium]|nr:hypothetical protein [Deltaproteobacteria bacterium]
MRELDNIRQFITGSALTLVLDVVFAALYIGVLMFYNATLCFITLVTVGAFVVLNLLLTPIFRARLNDRF